jgi:uncharacterized protein (DUF924 family)
MSAMHITLIVVLFLAGLMVWLLRPSLPRRSSYPPGPGKRRELPLEDFGAFMWMTGLPPPHLDAPGGERRASNPERSATPPPRTIEADAAKVVDFWRDAGAARRFAKDPAFDARFRERFLTLHESAARGALDHWARTAEGALALMILLDQFPRNAFRGTPRMYATDELARSLARRALGAGHDRAIEPALRLFLYLPFAHSEVLADQERSVALNAALGEPSARNAQRHHDIVARFGRFPHRNAILGRDMRPEEQAYLDAGGYAG